MTGENGFFGEEKSTITLRDRLVKYIANWPLFLICLLVCIGAGILYSRYTIPKYIANTSFLIKGIEGGVPYSNDLIEEALNGKQRVNLNNEILMISSSRLMQRTVAKNNFNVSYFKKGRLLTLNIYEESPFRLVALIADSNLTYNLYIEKMNSNGGEILYEQGGIKKSYIFKWNIPIAIGKNRFTLSPKGNIQNSNGKYSVRWNPIDKAAAELSNGLSVKSFDTKTSVIELSLKTENIQLGKDVLNALLAEFNISDIEDRNKLSNSTVVFINERLISVTDELKGVEGTLENFQGSRQLVDVKGQSAQSLENSSDVIKIIKDINIQQSIASMISEYFASPANNNKLVPSSLGLNDPTLSSLLAQYNELQLKKERESPNVAPNSTVMQDLNAQTLNLKSSILENLYNINKNLNLRESSFMQQNRQYNSFLSSLPHNERVLQEIKRKQSITEGLYLYLLQKREEAAISSTSANVAHYKQIDPANGYGPVDPNTRNIILYTAMLGFFLAFGWIYLRDLLNDKITSREDILKRTTLQLVGQISHVQKKDKHPIPVLERNIIGEQFRAIRTNLSFILKKESQKVILVSSCASNEGKSFVSLNLAAVFAMPGKKVALLEFDIRKPVIVNRLQLQSEKGLTDYLVGKVNDLSEIFRTIDEVPGLHIYPSGIVPSNPGDILLSENISKLFEVLKQGYDYIIVDSPPAELVSDAFVLGEYSDIVLFIVRQRVTLKKQLNFIEDFSSNEKFKKTVLVLNDLKADRKYGYYDYRYEEYEQKINKKTKLV